MSIPKNEIICDDLNDAIDHYIDQLGYRLDMIVPADAPVAAVLSKDGESVRLEISSEFLVPNSKLRKESESIPGTSNSELGTRNLELETWIKGRAGMEYRDLIPDRLGGKMIASHIRLSKGGEVADYVHYHKVDFQMIYCKRGRIRVVYEDQGPPFWLETGDCVLQPPEIRHRVLECTAGAEVIEIGMPAVHETWVEHDISLPTSELKPDRHFRGQQFVRHIAADATWIPVETAGCHVRETGISAATSGFAKVIVTRPLSSSLCPSESTQIHASELLFLFALSGDVIIRTHVGDEYNLTTGDSCVIPPALDFRFEYSNDAELLEVSLGKQ